MIAMLPMAASGWENPEQLFAYLQAIYNRHDKNFHDYLLVELNQYVAQFPDSAKTAEAQYLLARVYQEKGDKQKAAAAFLKTIYLYSGSSWQQEAAKEARKMIAEEGAFKEKRAKLLALIEGTPKGQAPADRYYEYLNAAPLLDNSEVYGLLADETRKFLLLFPEDARQDTTVRMMAEFYAKKGDKHEAEASYLRLEYCCAESPLLPAARYSRGVLLSKELGDHKTAIQALGELAAKNPQSEYATLAIFKIGEIKKEKTKDYAGAMADYRKFVETSPDSAKAVEALWAIAEINTNNTRDYGGAIAAYHEIVEKHKSDKRAVAAFEKIGDVFKDKLADYNKAAEQYAKIVEVFPDYEKAPELILKAGALCEDKLRDYNRATDYYRLVIDKFPQHKSADEARKRFEKAKAKATQ
jgi:TolA-binding protein